VALLGGVLTGCGDEPDPPTTEPTEGESSSATTESSVSVAMSGGVAGVEERWQLDPEDERAEPAFEVAAMRSEPKAEIAELDNEPVCCDFFIYNVTIEYADGSSLQAMVDDDPQATLLWDLIHVVPDPATPTTINPPTQLTHRRRAGTSG
jgi:hypothetical protein